VRDLDVTPPRAAALEVRAEALWAELVCETPLEHWSVGLEAFGVRLDHPRDALGDERGERVPIGLDLEFEAASPPIDLGGTGYVQCGSVAGEVLVGRATLPLDDRAVRLHEWGPAPWWAPPRARLACLVDADELLFVREDSGGALALWWREPCDPEVLGPVRATHHAGADGLPAASRITIGAGVEVDVEVEAVAPLLVEAADGRRGRFVRAACRFGVRDGQGDREGRGWADWVAAEPGARG
jgi:hypothetical protein